jgi:hypothetical protein
VLQQLMRSSPTIHYLEHDSRILRLQNDDGTEVRCKVFGSPYIPAKRPRAFGYTPENGASKWNDIPLDADIVVTHTPAKYHLDESASSGAVGCPHLREALWRVRPKLFVCGHIHEGRGVEVVQWDLRSPNVKFKESGLSRILDETGQSKKHFRVNLSSASTQPLRNDGSQCELVPCSLAGKLRGLEIDGNGAPAVVGRSTRGQGGSSCSSDAEAVRGREGRLETCIVNASYVSSTNLSRSHRASRSFNKPVIVDLDFRADGGAHEWYANALL